MTVDAILRWGECIAPWGERPDLTELRRIVLGVAIVSAACEDTPAACSSEITLPENRAVAGYEPGGRAVHTYRIASHDRARLHTAAEAAENPRMSRGMPTPLFLGRPGGAL